MAVLITGGAGFIGFHLCMKRLYMGDIVVAVDNLNSYYDVSLKKARLSILEREPRFKFIKLDISDRDGLERIIEEYNIDKVVNLAAQAGVRHSIEMPMDYIDSNVVGFTTILEACRHNKIKHLVYASTSSVYGANGKQPFSEQDGVNHPLAIYAATKRFNELAAHAYSSLYNLPTTGLRFFSVYGPWGRPDMALFKFTKNIMNGVPIDVYNNGCMVRDFTYIDDIVSGVSLALDSPATPSGKWVTGGNNPPDVSYAPFGIYNIGNTKTINLIEYIEEIESCLGKKAILKYLPMQDGDVISSCSDISSMKATFGYKPETDVRQGIRLFIDWYLGYYK